MLNYSFLNIFNFSLYIQDGTENGSQYVLFVFLLFYVLDVVSITVFDRDTLLNIGSSVTQRKPDFEFLNAGGLFTDTASEPFVWVTQPPPTGNAADAEKEGRELAFSSDWDAVLSDPLSQPFCWLTFSHWITNSANCVRASHTNEKQVTAVLFASQKPGCLQWFQTQPSSSQASPCTAQIEQRSSQGKAEAGVCFYINNSWCNERNIHSIKSFCSPYLEFHMLLCRPFWLPREFTAIIITAVYIPLQANTDQALRELYRNISEEETTHPDAAFIITGDFNKANFRTIAPKYFQHITINTRGDRILDHCYSPFRDAYKSLPRPPFCKSDHSSDNTMLVGPIGRYTTGLFWSRGLGHVPGSVWWRHRGVFRFRNMFHQEVYRWCSSDQNHPHLPQP